MNNSLFTPEERAVLDQSVLVRHRLEEQYRDLDQQEDTAILGMWVFLTTEVMFFGALFVGLAAYRYYYAEAFMKASSKLNWIIGSINALVLVVSGLTMVLAVYYASRGRQRRLLWLLTATALLGVCFLCLKGLEYYTDYRDNLIPGWRFDADEWVNAEGLDPSQVPHVKLFLMFYWIMTGLHALHVALGIGAILFVLVLAWKRHFSPIYYSPVEVLALYWAFVDIVWNFLLPMLYLLGTHTSRDFHF